MQAAQATIMTIGHPDEPDGPLASFLSDVVEIDNGAEPNVTPEVSW